LFWRRGPIRQRSLQHRSAPSFVHVPR
jgi:hypothetical protein